MCEHSQVSKDFLDNLSALTIPVWDKVVNGLYPLLNGDKLSSILRVDGHK